NAGAQSGSGLQGALVESDSGIEHAFSIGGVNLERSVMRGDDADASSAQEVLGDGDGERGAFFGIGRRAELIEQYQRIGHGGSGNEIYVGDVGGKSGKILFDRLIVANICEHRAENR